MLPFCHGREKDEGIKFATRHYELYSVSPPETTTTTEEAAFGAKKHSLGLSTHPHTSFTTNVRAIGDEEYVDGSGFPGWFRESINFCLHECQISQLYRTKKEQRGSVREARISSLRQDDVDLRIAKSRDMCEFARV